MQETSGTNRTNEFEGAGGLLGMALLTNELKHKGIGENDDDNKYEYYTSEDEQGRRI